MKQSSGDNLQGYLNGERRTGCAHKGMYGECREINNMVFQSAGVEGQKTESQKLLNRCSKLILGTAADRGIRASLAGRKVIGPPRAPGPSLHLEQSTSKHLSIAYTCSFDSARCGLRGIQCACYCWRLLFCLRTLLLHGASQMPPWQFRRRVLALEMNSRRSTFYPSCMQLI